MSKSSSWFLFVEHRGFGQVEPLLFYRTDELDRSHADALLEALGEHAEGGKLSAVNAGTLTLAERLKHDERWVNRAAWLPQRSWIREFDDRRWGNLLLGRLHDAASRMAGLLLPGVKDPQEKPQRKPGMTWQEAKEAGERYLDTHDGVFPGVRAMARIVGSLDSVMSKAIGQSRKLKAAQARGKTPKVGALTGMVLDSTPQQTESEPEESEMDVALEALITEQVKEQQNEERQATRARRRSRNRS